MNSTRVFVVLNPQLITTESGENHPKVLSEFNQYFWWKSSTREDTTREGTKPANKLIDGNI